MIKNFFAFLLFQFCLIQMDTYAQMPPPEKVAVLHKGKEVGCLDVITVVENDAYIIRDCSFVPAFSCLLRASDRSWLAVDTPYSPLATDALIDWVKKKHGQDQKFVVINTHHHIDRLGGNKAYIQKGFPVYAIPLTHQYFDKNNQTNEGFKAHFSSAPKPLLDSLNYTKPSHILKGLDKAGDKVSLTFGSLDVQILYPGHAHSIDNIVVLVPKYKLLFGGCMVICPYRNLGRLEEADLHSWEKAIQNVQKFVEGYDIQYVVPGHSID